MKMKNKMIALVEIAIVLCSLFLVALPAIAAEQNQEMQKVSANTITTASEDDFVLGIYGNANEDDTIDMGDVVYTKLAIFGKKPKTELCDAKYDGRINVLDVIQTKLIILGKEKELTVIDSADRIVTVKKPVERLVVCYPHALEALRSLKVSKDLIVGIAQDHLDTGFFPEFSDVSSVGWRSSPDIEVMLTLHPDAVIIGTYKIEPTVRALESAGITVLAFKCNNPDIHQEEMNKLGYLFDKENEAEEYLDWREEILNSIKDKVEKIPEEDKPKVYFETSGQYGTHRSCGNFIKAGGGKNIFEGMSGKIDAEAVIDRDPDIIVKLAVIGGPKPSTSGGYGADVGDTSGLEEIREEVISRPELQNVKAVKEGKVYVITIHLVSFYPSSGNRHFIQIAYLAKWFHPEIFKDLDPKQIHQEYLARFQGLDIDLDEKGVFVYHPEEHPDGH